MRAKAGWHDHLALVLQETEKKNKGTVYRRVGMAGLKEDLPGDGFEPVGRRRRITIV